MSKGHRSALLLEETQDPDSQSLVGHHRKETIWIS